MMGFYYGNVVPDDAAAEGIYFIKESGKPYAIYTKIDGNAVEKYADVNEEMSVIIEEAKKHFLSIEAEIAGLHFDENAVISAEDLKANLELGALAYKDKLEPIAFEAEGDNTTVISTEEIKHKVDTSVAIDSNNLQEVILKDEFQPEVTTTRLTTQTVRTLNEEEINGFKTDFNSSEKGSIAEGNIPIMTENEEVTISYYPITEENFIKITPTMQQVFASAMVDEDGVLSFGIADCVGTVDLTVPEKQDVTVTKTTFGDTYHFANTTAPLATTANTQVITGLNEVEKDFVTGLDINYKTESVLGSKTTATAESELIEDIEGMLTGEKVIFDTSEKIKVTGTLFKE